MTALKVKRTMILNQTILEKIFHKKKIEFEEQFYQYEAACGAIKFNGEFYQLVYICFEKKLIYIFDSFNQLTEVLENEFLRNWK